MIARLREGLGRGITRNVVMLGLVSLLTDVSSEMLVYVVPLFLANVLAASPAIIGIIEGVALSAAGLLQLVSGRLSDVFQRRRLLVATGYGASTLAKALYLVAVAWPVVLLARLGDRLGKGIRTSPRDALIGDSTDPAYRGKAFGLHRAMDTSGAFLGVLAAVVVVGLMQASSTQLDAATFNTLVLLALVPAVLSILLIFVGVRDVRRATTPPPTEPVAPPSHGLRARLAQLPAPFWIFVAANVAFSLGNSSDAFLALRTQQLGVAVRDLLLMVVGFNAANALISFPAGALSDRFGRRVPLMLAWLIYAAAYAGFAAVNDGGWTGWLWLLYGGYYGINDAVGKALIADVAPARLRATGYGILNASIAMALLPASILAGILWTTIAPAAPFWFGAICAVAATGLLFFVRPRRADVQGARAIA